MDHHKLTAALLGLFTEERKKLICPNRGIVLRSGGLLIGPAEQFEAGDIIIIPPSLVTTDAPSKEYIQGCLEKCWPQIQEKLR